MICWTADEIKTTVQEVKTWRYRFGPPYGRDYKTQPKEFNRCLEWAIIVIDEKGMFAAVSDYGEYVHHWSGWAPGQDIRQFLIGAIGDTSEYFPEYFMGKLVRRDNYLHVDRTKKLLQEHLADWIKDGSRSMKFCWDEWKLIKNCVTQEDLHEWVACSQLDEPYRFFSYWFDGMAENFGRYILPRLREVLKEQLKREQLEKQTDAERTQNG